MSDEQPSSRRYLFSDWFDNLKLPFNRFFFFLSIVVMIAIAMGMIGFRMYQLSDATSLDLSPPQYQSVRKEVKQDIKGDPAVSLEGEVNAKFKQEVLDGLSHYYQQIGDGQTFSELPLLDENLINNLLIEGND